MADAEIKAGSLRLVLEKFALPSCHPCGVPNHRPSPGQVKLFVDFMQDELSAILYFLGVRAPIERISSG